MINKLALAIAAAVSLTACGATFHSRPGITVYYLDEADGRVKSYQLQDQSRDKSPPESLCDLCNEQEK